MKRASGRGRSLLWRELLADVETPVGVYWKLAFDEEFSYLLESVTGGENLARYSIIGVRPRTVLRTKNAAFSRLSGGNLKKGELLPGEDPLHLLQRELEDEALVTEPGLPTIASGAVGMLAYDLVRFFEQLPDSCIDDLQVDDLAMLIGSSVVVFDHAQNLMRIVVSAESNEEGFATAENELDRIEERLLGELPALPQGVFPEHPVESNTTKADFEKVVERMVKYVTEGDGVQFVPSQRFKTRVDSHPLTVYRSLRSINPSPYMFLLRLGNYDLVGASPELLVSLHGRTAHVRPIAGTRWRGIDAEEDARLMSELLGDEKERAEHVMLVDLGRNDLGRVCEYGSVKVNDLMTIEKYSHVMHIVSDVDGILDEKSNSFDLFRACFPAGTVSGAPKVRAMQIIDDLESTRRGPYAGAVGSFSSNGDVDTCIAIRTILLKDGNGYVQAGGGVVYDSVAENEYQESCNKARASLKAIEKAQRGLKA